MATQDAPGPGRTLIGVLPRRRRSPTGWWPSPAPGSPSSASTSRAAPGSPLTAEGRTRAPESLDEARKIIDQRVNGSGVAEAEVTTQGNKYIVVEIPGESRARPRSTRSSARPSCGSGWSPAATPPRAAPARRRRDPPPDAEPDGRAPSAPRARRRPTAGSDRAADADGRPPPTSRAADQSRAGDQPTPEPAPTESAPADDARRAPTTEDADRSGRPTDAGRRTRARPTSTTRSTWIDDPTQEAIDAYNAFTCPPTARRSTSRTTPSKPLVTCERRAPATTSARSTCCPRR